MVQDILDALFDLGPDLRLDVLLTDIIHGFVEFFGADQSKKPLSEPTGRPL